jgi:hypothetical protein
MPSKPFDAAKFVADVRDPDKSLGQILGLDSHEPTDIESFKDFFKEGCDDLKSFRESSVGARFSEKDWIQFSILLANKFQTGLKSILSFSRLSLSMDEVNARITKIRKDVRQLQRLLHPDKNTEVTAFAAAVFQNATNIFETTKEAAAASGAGAPSGESRGWDEPESEPKPAGKSSPTEREQERAREEAKKREKDMEKTVFSTIVNSKQIRPISKYNQEKAIRFVEYFSRQLRSDEDIKKEFLRGLADFFTDGITVGQFRDLFRGLLHISEFIGFSSSDQEHTFSGYLKSTLSTEKPASRVETPEDIIFVLQENARWEERSSEVLLKITAKFFSRLCASYVDCSSPELKAILMAAPYGFTEIQAEILQLKPRIETVSDIEALLRNMFRKGAVTRDLVPFLYYFTHPVDVSKALAKSGIPLAEIFPKSLYPTEGADLIRFVSDTLEKGLGSNPDLARQFVQSSGILSADLHSRSVFLENFVRAMHSFGLDAELQDLFRNTKDLDLFVRLKDLFRENRVDAPTGAFMELPHAILQIKELVERFCRDEHKSTKGTRAIGKILASRESDDKKLKLINAELDNADARKGGLFHGKRSEETTALYKKLRGICASCESFQTKGETTADVASVMGVPGVSSVSGASGAVEGRSDSPRSVKSSQSIGETMPSGGAGRGEGADDDGTSAFPRH